MLDFRPFQSLNFGLNLVSTRDLRNYGDTTTVGLLTKAESKTFLGRAVGFERDRRMTTVLSLNPALTSWLRPRFLTSSSFTLNRDPNRRDAARLDGDTAGAFALPTSFSNLRRNEIGLSLDWATLAKRAFGEDTFGAKLFGGFLPSDWRREVTRRSTYDRSAGTPPVGYQLALGGLSNYLSVGGLEATSATENVVRGLTGGIRLPLGFNVNGSYLN